MPYTTVNSLLKQTHPDLSAAEAHGIATGMLCVNRQTTPAYWLDALLEPTTSPSDAEPLLVRLFEETRRLLASDSFEFALLLPDDEQPLPERLLALKDWCHGFLFGTGCGQPNTALSNDTQSILRDVAEFTKLDTAAEGEEDESAFVEITEYLKSSVLLFREELGDDSGRALH